MRGGCWIVTDHLGIEQPGIVTANSVVMFVQHPDEPGRPRVGVPTFD